MEKPNPPHMAKGKVEESDRYAQKGPFKLSSGDGEIGYGAPGLRRHVI